LQASAVRGELLQTILKVSGRDRQQKLAYATCELCLSSTDSTTQKLLRQTSPDVLSEMAKCGHLEKCHAGLFPVAIELDVI